MPVHKRTFSSSATVPLLCAFAWPAAGWAGLYYWWPFVLVALVPFALLAAWAIPSPLRVALVLVSGMAYFAATEFWFAFTSIGGWLILALLQGATLLPVALAVRWSHRRFQVPMVIALPVGWVAGEYLRSLGPLGFPVGALAPSLARQLWAIQTADLGGMFLVSFLVAAAAGALADCFLLPRQPALRAIGMAACLWAANAAYGAYRLRESEQTMRAGPLAAVVQPDVPSANDVGVGYDPDALFGDLVRWTRAVMIQRPTLIVWPETLPFPALNPEFYHASNEQKARVAKYAGNFSEADNVEEWLDARMRGARDKAQVLAQLSREAGATIVAGSAEEIPAPPASHVPWIDFNSARVFRPDGSSISRRKVFLFPVTEGVPFAGTALHGAFRTLTGWLGEDPEGKYDPGQPSLPLTLNLGGKSYKVALPICSEIDLARTSRIFGAEADILVNLSNDGGFQRSALLRVRLASLAFRAVESRAGIVRSSNTGISCFVKPTGEIHSEVRNAAGQSWTGLGFPEHAAIAEIRSIKTRSASPEAVARVRELVGEIERLRAEAGVEGFSVDRIHVDSRQTLYSAHGDVFAQALLILMGGAFLGAITSQTPGPRARE